MNVTFTSKALEEHIDWQTEDRKTLKSINKLIQSIQRDGLMKGLGKPEPLKYRDGFSRRIDDTNRLEYDGDGKQNVIILTCKGHYED